MDHRIASARPFGRALTAAVEVRKGLGLRLRAAAGRAELVATGTACQ